MQYYVRKLRRRSKSVATMMLEKCRVASMRVEREKKHEKLLDHRITDGRMLEF